MNIYTCPNCSKSVQRKLKDSVLVLCPKCSTKVFGTVEIKPHMEGVPFDLSVLQIGSKGKYKNRKFEIVGRIRIQMKDDFRSIWCAEYESTKPLWIVQSLENIAFAEDIFNPFPPSSNFDTRAGATVSMGDKTKLKIIFVGACIRMACEGEIARFPFLDEEFVFVHAANERGNTAIIVTQGSKGGTELLWGETKQLEDVAFQNTRTFDDWQQ